MWELRLVHGNTDEATATVPTWDAALEWAEAQCARRHQGSVLDEDFKLLNHPVHRQYGTGYHWLTLRKLEL